MLTAKETRRYDVQLCVVGGGLAGLFAAFCMLASFGIGNMTQGNSIASSM